VDSKSIVQEFMMDEKYPWINLLSSSPVEPIFVCAGSGNRTGSASKNSGALVAWSMKTMSACVSFTSYLSIPFLSIEYRVHLLLTKNKTIVLI
jgi:hypothetical protein